MGTSQSKLKFEDYDGFVEKFKPKKTTDDCYTPPEVMEVVNRYVSWRWNLDPAAFVRPFCPGGDYEHFDYPDGCVVVDNPPFSILAKIQAFYLARDVRFFLFAPALTCLSGRANTMKVDHIVCDSTIEYENGAKVQTGFVTNLCADYVLESDPGLGRAVNEASDRASKARKPRRVVAKYEYPDNVITSARCQWYAAHDTVFRVRRDQCMPISALDAQRENGKAIFGGGLLLSEKAAAEKAAAEKAAAEKAAAVKWQLSDREREMVRMLDKEAGCRR